MSNDGTATQTLNVKQLEAVIRKVVREELMTFAQEQGIFHLDKDSPLYKDMENILERKKSNQLKFHTHEEVWHG